MQSEEGSRQLEQGVARVMPVVFLSEAVTLVLVLEAKSLSKVSEG